MRNNISFYQKYDITIEKLNEYNPVRNLHKHNSAFLSKMRFYDVQTLYIQFTGNKIHKYLSLTDITISPLQEWNHVEVCQYLYYTDMCLSIYHREYYSIYYLCFVTQPWHCRESWSTYSYLFYWPFLLNSMLNQSIVTIRFFCSQMIHFLLYAIYAATTFEVLTG